MILVVQIIFGFIFFICVISGFLYQEIVSDTWGILTLGSALVAITCVYIGDAYETSYEMSLSDKIKMYDNFEKQEQEAEELYEYLKKNGKD